MTVRYRDNLPLVGANFTRMIYMVGSGVVLQLYLKELGASPFEVSLLEMVFWSALLIFSPLWGALSDSSGYRKVFLLVSILLGALVIPFYIFMDTIVAVLALRFSFSVITSAFPPVALAVMSKDSDGEERGKDIAPYHTSRALGFFLGWGGSGLLLDFLGFRSTFIAYALVGVLGFAGALRIRDVDSEGEISLREVWESARQRWVPSFGDVSFRRHGLHYLYIGIFLRKTAFIGIMSIIAVYAVDEVGLTASTLGVMLALNPLSQMAFLDFFGKVSDRYGRRNVFGIGFLGSVAFPILLAQASGVPLFGVAYLTLGFSFAAFVEGSTTFIGDVAPEGRQAEFMGFRKSFQGLAGVFGPLIAGYVATVYSYQQMLYLMAGIVFLSFLIGYLGTEESMETGDIGSLRQDVLQYVFSVGGG